MKLVLQSIVCMCLFAGCTYDREAHQAARFTRDFLAKAHSLHSDDIDTYFRLSDDYQLPNIDHAAAELPLIVYLVNCPPDGTERLREATVEDIGIVRSAYGQRIYFKGNQTDCLVTAVERIDGHWRFRY